MAMDNTNIRIRLKAFDHRVLDSSTSEIVSTAKRRREVSGTMQALGSGNVAALISGLAAEKDMNREVDQDVHERSAV